MVHWARDAEEARQIVVRLVKASGAEGGSPTEVIKIKSMTTEEIQLNKALEAAGIHAYETDLAELIIQLGHDQPSHIVVPALHKNRAQIREIFRREMNLPDLGGTPQDLADAARKFLREKFLRVKTGVSGANFLIAETGGVCIVESEGNGRMCLTLPETLIAVAGIDKVVPRFQDLEVLLQLLPRSATGERMNPYNSIWTGVDRARWDDGPRAFHVVLMDNARTEILADEESRQTLHCIRCGACQNACPVYQQTGGHAYGSVYAGPIGAILTPQLMEMQHAQSLPYASSLCGACYEVCPVKINIPEVLIHLRNKVVKQQSAGLKMLANPEAMALKAVAHDLPQRGPVPRGAETGADGGVAAGRGRMGRARAGSAGCRGCWADGRRCAICRRCRSRRSASGLKSGEKPEQASDKATVGGAAEDGVGRMGD